MKTESYLEYSEEVEEAIQTARPVVALESTIISHGMPYPQNLETAHAVSEIIRSQGAVPATIGIVNGKIKIGLNDEELEIFAQNEEVLKVSRRDLASVLSQKQHGGTTVAATMICAYMAGISVFVTGGVGGVHRQGESTMDVSADLIELSQTRVAVVCAGIKAILDIPRTLEVLETYGVPVIGYQSRDFPAFYTRSSGCKAPISLDSPEKIAQLMELQWELGLKSGILIGNPVPEKEAMAEEEIKMAIEQALMEAAEKSILGKEITPFLLDKIKDLTAGKSLQSNIALVKNNARLGAQIAMAFQTEKRK
ncbi:MAG: pseudouridine-5'-phosphate glycosidase [SAR324 cluster bacterium]|nr:pseudouridine-5'-phosphate glycosidase [SAR324 cluster bacterium]